MVSQEELWMPWSDHRQEYETSDWSNSQDDCERKCTWRNRLDHAPGDWRPVRIPTPRQLEATADLLAALKGILAITDRNHVAWHAAYAAIAKANGEGE